MDWGQDIYKKKKQKQKTHILSGRVPERYVKYVKDQRIDVGKLIMRSLEELDNSLKE